MATFALLKLISLVTPLRRTAAEEGVGLDIVHHGEEGYATGEGAVLVPAEFMTTAPTAAKTSYKAAPALASTGEGR